MRTDSTPVHGQDSAGPSSIEATKPNAISSGKLEDNTARGTAESTAPDEEPSEKLEMTQNVWIFIFRGYPYDTYNRRHVLFYLDSPDVEDFHITAHAQRPTEEKPFEYTENKEEQRYPMSIDLIHGRVVGRVPVDASQPRKLVDVIASTPVGGEPDWNCAHFVFHALERLNEAGAISPEQLNDTKDWMMDSLLDGAIG
ncbi:hypothetical protein INS49_004877 [Diaporthe citri]|uniref:uncharacterized protein n=1 Tax=Diaporthe citri TaxID=83186 RepID=UPI001C80C671|nr:uncharacterized protein INS49_004877 [Diaporthe citri]KAG6354272.1 hypothetical protein INS49_004877 [Diaporthe citri]